MWVRRCYDQHHHDGRALDHGPGDDGGRNDDLGSGRPHDDCRSRVDDNGRTDYDRPSESRVFDGRGCGRGGCRSHR